VLTRIDPTGTYQGRVVLDTLVVAVAAQLLLFDFGLCVAMQHY
jgi:hypothetical protein